MITGWRKGDLYTLSTMPELYFSNRFRSGPADIWHQRLGHPHFSSLQLLHNKSLINVKGTTKCEHVCDSCQFGKLVDYLFFVLNTLVLLFLKKSIVIYRDLLMFYQ
jgi:hypothetical protein